MNISFWLRNHGIRVFGIPLERFHERSWLRHIMWPPLRLRLQLLWLEIRLNRGWKVYVFHPWLQMDVIAWNYLTEDESKQYYANLARLRRRAGEQTNGFDAHDWNRARRGWLSFHQSPEPEIHVGWPRT